MGFLDIFFGKKKTEEKVSTEGVIFLEEEVSKSVKTLPIAVTHPRQHYIIKSEGKYFIYDSLNEMDEELRKQIESSEKIDEMKSIYTVFVDGKRTIYTHFNDIPDGIREAITKKKQG
ncbi:MAG: hypothetical protein A2X48_17850 [Lentisphaerae bacterium GWF2_49_21]|nr:MAG: hypothetical protein A2X48_17850 [Lentisphaerae bacterium GWF2_49_21]